MRKQFDFEPGKPNEASLELVRNASERGDARGVARGLEGVTFSPDDGTFAQDLKAVELRLRLADLFHGQHQRLGILSESRPGLLRGDNAKRRLYWGPHLGFKVIRYVDLIGRYQGRFDQRHKAQVDAFNASDLQPKATLAFLRQPETREGTMQLLGGQDFPKSEELIRQSRMIKGAVNSSLGELSENLNGIGDNLLLKGVTRQGILDVRENTNATFEEVGAYLHEASVQLHPPKTGE